VIAVMEVYLMGIVRGGDPYGGIGEVEAIMSCKLDLKDWSGRNKTK
jgi:hypothetical protein